MPRSIVPSSTRTISGTVIGAIGPEAFSLTDAYPRLVGALTPGCAGHEGCPWDRSTLGYAANPAATAPNTRVSVALPLAAPLKTIEVDVGMSAIVVPPGI